MIKYVVLAALFLSACSNAEPYMPLAAPEAPVIDQPRDSERPLAIGAKGHSPSETRALTAAYNASGHDLFRRFAATPGNVVLSPYSIGTAMAMAFSGARGDTEREMAGALRHTLERTRIDDANAGVLATLNGYGKTQLLSPKSARLKTANALMLGKAGGEIVDPSYAALLRDKYAAEIFHAAEIAQVNAWVSWRTEGKIAKLFDRLDPDTVLVLVNAVYFKATWQSTFRKTATTDADFNLSSSAKVRLPTMHQSGDFRVLARPGYRAIRLPYSVEALSMVVVLPDAIDGATALARRLDAAEVASLLAGLKTTRSIDLAMPRFKAAFRTSLVATFQQMGMKRPFDRARADLSGITGRTASEAPIAIDQIVHSAIIEVDEEGTEAAAATGVSAVLTSSGPLAEAFHIDRPFLFYITDDATGAILFQGRIDDPRKT
jgi:serpin B